MKTVSFKIIVVIGVICSIMGLTIKYNLRGQLEFQDLTFYNMALEKNLQNKSQNKTSNATAIKIANTTNVVGAVVTDDVRVTKAPYEITKCDQVILLNASRIQNFDNFTTRAPAFFTLSAYLINMFESQDNNKLVESINMANIRVLPYVLLGSKNCLYFQDSVNTRNATLCIDDEAELEQIKKSYSDFMTCRMGGDLNEFDPITINNVIKASCNGYNSTTGAKFDLPNVRSRMVGELKKAGFDVSEIITETAHFDLNNATRGFNNTHIRRPVDMRVPGTY